MKCVGAFILFVVFLLVHQGWAYEPPDQAVLIVTLPKSGTVFLVDSCKKNLSQFGYVHRQISPKRFHDDYVNERRLARFAGTHFFSLAHIDASVDNIAILQKHTPKVVLHLRDPRQAFLSWLIMWKRWGRLITFYGPLTFVLPLNTTPGQWIVKSIGKSSTIFLLAYAG